MWKKVNWSVVGWIFANAAFGDVLAMGLYFYGLRTTSATYSSIFMNLIPIATFLMAIVLRAEKLALGNWSGKLMLLGVLCVGGTMVVNLVKGKMLHIWPTNLLKSHTQAPANPTGPRHDMVVGTLWLCGSCLSYAIYFIVQARLVKVFPSTYLMTVLTSLLGSLQAFVVGVFLVHDRSEWRLKWDLQLLTVIYSGVFNTGLAFLLITWVIRRSGPIYPSMFNSLSLILTMVLDSLLLGTNIYLGSILGTVLVVLGLYAFLWGKGKELKLAATVAAQKEQQGGVILNTQKIQGYAELHNCGLAHLKSSALRCAVGLGIPNAIDRCGGVATISDIITQTGLHATKLTYLRRLMRVLTVCGIFDQSSSSSAVGEIQTVYKLNPTSRLLVQDDNSSALLLLFARPDTTRSCCYHTLRDGARHVSVEFDHNAMSHACIADSNLVMEIVLKEAHGIFHGLSSLIDVGGGHGAAAVAIAKVFPHITCSVLDLEQVISKAPTSQLVKYIVGDMFEFIPTADAILLKAVLNSWDDNSCIKILQQCKRAIPTRQAGGKILILNVVIGHGTPDNTTKEAQVLTDMYMMRGSGFEREEKEWESVFLRAGLSDYNIMPIIGPVSIIEVLP
uniref:O-methyltransferase domain-containing protein n=1 Tax=Oryza nivara TaxID=4536 RepID=A0A0E0I4T1_ORYNI